MTWDYLNQAVDAGLPQDAFKNFCRGRIVLQPHQLAMAAKARECDIKRGPVSLLVGGARGGGKSHWLLSQIAADDCQRMPNLKCLWLRKVGKANLEHLDDLRRTTLAGVPHNFRRHDGAIEFRNSSRIICGHFENENDIDAYLGLEYDVIAIEELTTLTETKYRNIRSCCRTSKKGWRPRDYSTTNPGGVGHGWVKQRFIEPYRAGKERDTRFVPALCQDNVFNNPEYVEILESFDGWQRRAWLLGDWDIAAGQFFTTWREDVHVLDRFDDKKGMEWFCAMDYGFQHWTVILLGCLTGEGDIVIVDEHAGRKQVPEWHVERFTKMLATHNITEVSRLAYFVAGSDIFATESDGASVASQYAQLGLHMEASEMDRVSRWSAILKRLGDPDKQRRPSLYVHRRCKMTIEQIPLACHNPKKPEDILKFNADDEGRNGDDALDCLSMLVISHRAGQGKLEWAMPMRVGGWHGSSV